jgi:ubiquinone/menaquinone biosynthesis C-methylase UbiE
MRRSTLDILSCPKCGADSLVPDARHSERAFSYGPARCLGCSARFSVSDGLLDFHDQREVDDRWDALRVMPKEHQNRLHSVFHRVMRSQVFARSWAHQLRPGLDRWLSRGRVDAQSEYTIVRNFLGSPAGPIVDVGCGTGDFLRRLSKDLSVPLVGLDASKAMLEEALDQAREVGHGGDLIRASVPPLPFMPDSIGALVATGVFHFLPNLEPFLIEARRVLKPKGKLVATSYSDSGFALSLQHRAGFYPRSESDLQGDFARAGFVAFECVTFARVTICKAEQP